MKRLQNEGLICSGSANDWISCLMLQYRNRLLIELYNMFQQCAFSPSEQREQLLAQFEIQRSLCSQYIKMASSQLHMREAQVLSSANDLLQQLTVKEKVKDFSEWDVFSTRDSVVLEDQSSFNFSAISQPTRSRVIQRKSALTSRNTKDNEETLNECMGEVQKQCSNKTVTTVRNLVEQYKKLKGRVFQLQKKEKGMKLKQKLLQQLQEKNVILNNKIEELERDLAKYRGDCVGLKAENSQLMEEIRKKTQEVNSERKIKIYGEIYSHQQSSGKKESKHPLSSHLSYDTLNGIIQQKENLLNLRYSQIKALESKLQEQLFSEQDRCGSCCEMLKKVKHSIISYKKYLEQEGANFEELVDRFKQKLLDQCLTST